MLIPNKHSGYQGGVRRLHIGGGGGGGGPAEPVVTPPPARLPTAAPPPKFTTYGQGDRTGSLVQSGNSYRPSTLDYSRPIYDPNYADNITGYQQSSQFNQPIYQQQSANYTNPLTAFNVSNYGTNPGMSKSMQQASAPGGMGAGAYYQELQNYGTPNSRIRNVEPGGINFNNLVQDMRRYNMSGQDFQNASEYNPAPSGVGGGGGSGGSFNYQPSSSNTLTPAIAKSLMQASMSGGVNTSEFNRYGGYDKVKAAYDAGGGSYAPPGQQSNAQSTAQPTALPPTQFNPYTNSFGATGGAFPTQTPFSYQTASGQPKTPFSYQTSTGQTNKDYGLSYSAPMQLPQYVYDTIRDIDSYQSQPVQKYISPRATSSGPSQAIVGRSSQVRGTPNVVAKKAAGGIASLLDKYK
jgi:hypothetical protein